VHNPGIKATIRVQKFRLFIIILPNDNDDNDDDVFRHLLIVHYACVHLLCLIPCYVSAHFFARDDDDKSSFNMHKLVGGTGR